MENLIKLFKLTENDGPEYKLRLEQEIKIFNELGLVNFIQRVVEIYNNHISKYPVLLRGSAGSSLLLYYLGINKIDPVKYSIPISRFINLERKTLPDIDFDLPNSIRNKLIDEILLNNPDTIRMTSCFSNPDNIYYDKLVKEDPTLNIPHNSGVIIYSNEQKDIIESNIVLPNQIGLTKDNIGKYGLKKIDILSNTALEQLYNINKKQIFQYDFEDKKVFDFISNDDGIGITLAETPSIQNVIKILKPSNIEELSICMALIRPLAVHLITPNLNWEYLKNQIIYDDDFIIFLMNKLNLTEDKADNIRRLFKNKNEPEKMLQIKMDLEQSNLDQSSKSKINYILNNLCKYGFCKSHSINYAQMIYCLYWNKMYKPKEFWKSTIKSVKGYYRDWVYIRKALTHGIKFKGIENCSPFYHLIYTGYWLKKDFVSRCYLRKISSQPNNLNTISEQKEIVEYKEIDENNQIIFEINSNDNLEQYKSNLESDESVLESSEINLESGEINLESNELDLEQEYKIKYKYNTEYEFRGIIAGIGSISNRYKKYQMVITLGYDNNKFINIHLNKKRDFSRFKQIFGKGYWIGGETNPHIIVTKMTLM